MQKFSLHMHTIGFDGKNTPAEMVDIASARQMDAVGISNHFIVHPYVKQSNLYAPARQRGYSAIYSSDFDEVMSRFTPHFQDVAQLRSRRTRILRGMEADFFQYPEWRSGFEKAISKLKPDYIIGATHFIEGNNQIYNVHDLTKFSRFSDLEPMMQKYWTNIKLAAESGLFNIIAHIDLPKKVGIYYQYFWEDLQAAAMDAIANAGCTLEINTSIFSKLGEPYPSRKLLKMAIERDIPLILSDDAHNAQNIGHDFNEVENWARECGAKNFVGYQKILDFSKQRA